MILLGVVLILLASLIPGIDPSGKKAMLVCGILLLVIGVVLLIVPGIVPASSRPWIY